MRSLSLVVGVLCSAAVANAGEITVHTDFEGGSAKAVEIDQDSEIVSIMPGGDPARGWTCWWYLRVDGLRDGEKLTLKVAGSDAPIVREGKHFGKPLPASWAQPLRAAYSHDGKEWRQSDPGHLDKQVMTYRIKSDGSSLWLAWGPPFTPTDGARLVKHIDRKHDWAEEFELTKTDEGRPCPALRICDGDDNQRPAVWIQARQHAWESGSSWVCRGLTEWLAGDDKRAERLREKCEFFIVPIMDIDHAATGDGGKESVPQDHNRDWTDQPHHEEVAAAQKRIRKLSEEKRLALFIDLHNPGPSDKQPYFYCCPDYTLSDAGKQNLERFLTLARGEINGPLALADKPRESGPSYDPLWKQMSKNWVAANAPPFTVAVTLETSWNTPHSNIDGYQTVGAQLGQAISRYLQDDPRK